jgi:hypothetical protein
VEPARIARPREITAAAVAALIGGGLLVLFGLLSGFGFANLFHSISQKYPGLTFRQTDSRAPYFQFILITMVATPLVVGVLGVVTGFGLLQMRLWARVSVLVWCVVSTLACFVALFYPGPHSEFRINPALVYASMLVIVPVNSWLLLLLRPRRKAVAQTPALTRGIAQPRSAKVVFTPTRVILAVVILLAGAALGWLKWVTSPMREIERSSAAVARSKSWHYHTARPNFSSPDLPPETFDKDTFCPSYQRTVQKGTGSNGAPITIEYINFQGRGYSRSGDQWMPSRGRQQDVNAQGSLPILECSAGTPGGDDNSLPYPAILADGDVRRGAIRDVDGTSCRDYEITVPTPHDTTEKDFRFSMCINESDHLPREARRTPPGSSQEGVSTFSQWNAWSEPPLPAGFPD